MELIAQLYRRHLAACIWVVLPKRFAARIRHVVLVINGFWILIILGGTCSQGAWVNAPTVSRTQEVQGCGR